MLVGIYIMRMIYIYIYKYNYLFKIIKFFHLLLDITEYSFDMNSLLVVK